MERNLLFVENKDGRQFAVKLLAKGDTYGLDKCLDWESDKTGVEFYDVTYAGAEKEAKTSAGTAKNERSK